MNVRGSDFLNFMDSRDQETHGLYNDEGMNSKHGIDTYDPSTLGDMDDLASLNRKESRIPVPVRKIRSRIPGDSRCQNMSMGDVAQDKTPRYQDGCPNKIDDWQGGWNISQGNDKDGDRKIKHQKRRLSQSQIVPVQDKGTAIVCPQCHRGNALITKDGIYLSMSIGFIPLFVIILAVIILLLSGSNMVPHVMQKFRRAPAPELKVKPKDRSWSFFSGWGNSKRTKGQAASHQ